MKYPTNHQELFEFAVEQRRTVIAEFGYRLDYLALRYWACGYAKDHGLAAVVSDDADIIYNLPDEEEKAQLLADGLL